MESWSRERGLDSVFVERPRKARREVGNLVEFLLARINEDAAWAHEASRPDAGPSIVGGEHWRWECQDGEVVDTPIGGVFMGCSREHWSMSLCSVEEYPYRLLPDRGPSIHLTTESELKPAIGGHIARHDPARVLAECEAKRRLVEHHGPYAGGRGRPTLLLLALPYADHPDYDEAWRFDA